MIYGWVQQLMALKQQVLIALVQEMMLRLNGSVEKMKKVRVPKVMVNAVVLKVVMVTKVIVGKVMVHLVEEKREQEKNVKQ